MSSSRLEQLDVAQSKLNSRNYLGWSNADEREFIRLMARGEPLSKSLSTPIEKLRNYILALEARSTLGEINQEDCLAYARAWLEKLEAAQA